MRVYKYGTKLKFNQPELSKFLPNPKYFFVSCLAEHEPRLTTSKKKIFF